MSLRGDQDIFVESKEKIELTKIGLVTLAGLIALLASIFWLKGHKVHNFASYTFYFENVNSLEEGATVRWNGVRAGVVEEVKPVSKDMVVEPIAAQLLVDLGKKHLEMAQEALRGGKVEDLAFAREYINRGQMEIALGREGKTQKNIYKGRHVKVSAVITLKDLPIGEINQVSIVPSGLIGEQFLEITTLLIPEDKKDFEPQFVVREPVKLDTLIRTNVESAESIKNLTNRVNAIFTDADADSIKLMFESLSDVLGDPRFRQDLKDGARRIRSFKLKDLLF